MIVGIGTDIVDVARIKTAFDEYGERFLKRIFTPLEIEYCDSFGEPASSTTPPGLPQRKRSVRPLELA